MTHTQTQPTPKSEGASRLFRVALVAVSLCWPGLLGIAGVAGSDAMAQTTQPQPGTFAAAIEKAHGLEAWRRQGAVSANITVTFGGKPMLQGSMLFDTSVGRVRMELANGNVMVFDGQEAWVAPADSKMFQGARFHLLTWPYFMAAPMKLRDPGSHLQDTGLMPLQDGRQLPSARLTFDAGVGDSPDDWYILYRDDTTHRLVAMAYIVTFDKSKAEAEKQPHAVTYEQFQTIEGVAFSTQWRFWNWNAKTGLHGEPIGSVRLSGIEFVTPDPDAFIKPPDARQDDLPG